MLKVKPLYLGYFAVFFTMVGVILAPVINSKSLPEEEVDHRTHITHDHSMMHKQYEVPDTVLPPSVQLSVEKDDKSGWNLFIETQNFAFTAQDVNKENVPNTGHGHIYINGEKTTRLYSKAYYLSDLLPGEYEIAVSLNTNDHSDYMVKGKKVMSSVVIVQQ